MPELFKPNLQDIQGLFHSIYNVPVYQRPYSWNTGNMSILLTDLWDSFQQSEADRDFYVGNLTIRNKDSNIAGTFVQYDVIDGQQRITSFTIILMIIYFMLNKFSVNVELSDACDKTASDIKSCLWKYYNRKHHENDRVMTLNSIEQKMFTELFNMAFFDLKNLLDWVKSYPVKLEAEENIRNNFLCTYEFISKKTNNDVERLLDFTEFFLTRVQVITVESKCTEQKTFNVFEAINSKGKKLDEIDLIKLYVFSIVDKKRYSKCIKLWGNLLVETKDNLYDYLLIYIRAYIKYIGNNLKVADFKNISENELLYQFSTESISDALEEMLEDMYKNVQFYNMLFDDAILYNFVKRDSEIGFYGRILASRSYKHPRALLYRALIEYSQERLSKKELCDIFRESIIFMLKFLTVLSHDSKDVIKLFKSIMDYIQNNNEFSANVVKTYIKEFEIKENITPQSLREQISVMDFFEKNNDLGVAFLAICGAYDNGKVSYDNAYGDYINYGQIRGNDIFAMDHLLPRNPEKKEEKLCYYKSKSELLELKRGHDFPNEFVSQITEYKDFLGRVLNKIGNLRLYYRDKNKERGNKPINISGKWFVTYSDIVKREEKLTNILLDTCLHSQRFFDLVPLNKKNKSKKLLMRLDEMIKRNIIQCGTKIWIVGYKGSEATILDGNNVSFNGKKMTKNKWGQSVTGWTSICIYEHAALVGTTKTLDDMRNEYITNSK